MAQQHPLQDYALGRMTIRQCGIMLLSTGLECDAESRVLHVNGWVGRVNLRSILHLGEHGDQVAPRRLDVSRQLQRQGRRLARWCGRNPNGSFFDGFDDRFGALFSAATG